MKNGKRVLLVRLLLSRLFPNAMIFDVSIPMLAETQGFIPACQNDLKFFETNNQAHGLHFLLPNPMCHWSFIKVEITKKIFSELFRIDVPLMSVFTKIFIESTVIIENSNGRYAFERKC